MPEVHILVEGYVRDGGRTVQGTVTLVRDEERNIVADPGMTRDPRAIPEALQKLGLTTDDIDTVFVTHHHPDHTRYAGMFGRAKMVDHHAVYDRDLWLDINDGYRLTPNVTMLRTPGHTDEDATLIVSNVTNIPGKSPCTVAICHLWWFKGKDDDPTAENTEQLHASRQQVQAAADYIIPGHGGMFATINKNA